ncbi:MAG: DNA repair protein RecO [Elusimicrobia bacterium]|nr:DNA repair protein RecO [Elusimicrobiota bacterium]
MILTTEAVVLSRRPLREVDRLVVMYTRDFGRLAARFVGVDRPRAKLKALSEPMVYGEYRLFARLDGRLSTMTGGRLVTTYPGLRGDFGRTVAGLEMCELLQRMTPERSPNELKFELIRDFLSALEDYPSPCLPLAFGIRLMELAGFGIPPSAMAEADRPLWSRLAETDVLELRNVGEDPAALGRLRGVLEHAVEHELGYMLGARQFRTSMERSREPRPLLLRAAEPYEPGADFHPAALQ